MAEPTVRAPFRPVRGERVVIRSGSTGARVTAAAALLTVAVWFASMGGELAWSLAVLCAVGFIARGVFLGRPVTAAHAAAAAAAVLAGIAAHLAGFGAAGNALIALSGLLVVLPTTARPTPDELPRVWALVNATTGDPLAPFAMHVLKSHLFTADGTAAIAYRTRWGYAVVSGDPVGDKARYTELVADFAALCHSRGWRIAVLGCSPEHLALWSDRPDGRRLRPIPFGRDVVVDIQGFAMQGRRFRNLRQAVQRTRNAGITTEILDEADLAPARLAELTDLLTRTRGARHERGFSMNLGGTLTGWYPGVRLIVARDRSGRVQGMQRFATAGRGSDISLDLPWRCADAPNGIDERLTVDMIAAVKEAGGQRLSLAFAAFPDLFDDPRRDFRSRIVYQIVHLGDGLIRLESLYRYLCKFNALAEQRYVVLSLRNVVPLLLVFLSLEFTPRRRAD